jgi:hypothetical protein
MFHHLVIAIRSTHAWRKYILREKLKEINEKKKPEKWPDAPPR